MKRLLRWLLVGLLTGSLIAVTTAQALNRYAELRSGWSWDLAYYNQWFWALTKGDGTITVRPIAGYATEGPSVWKTNYLAPIRYLIAPIYAGFPDARTLLVIQSAIFWLIVPASYSLVKSESDSPALALSAACLVPATPLAWPLVWNDFRELQLATPFVLWAVQGWRSRDRRLTIVASLAMLACRQEYGVVVASLAIVPPREREDMGRTYVWSWCALMAGLCWVLLVFFGHLVWKIGWRAPESYLEQFQGRKPPLRETVDTALDFLIVGMGSWALLALAAPRIAITALPWLWSLSSGKWALRFIGTEQWHHVRYTAPIFALVLAAGLVGYARIGRWASGFDRIARVCIVALIWTFAALGMVTPNLEMQTRMVGIPNHFSREEAREIQQWIHLVGPEDGVLAHYDVTAPLSSRRLLYSYVMDQNKPRGYPELPRTISWVFVRGAAVPPETLIKQGFRLVYEGKELRIYRRPNKNSRSESKIFSNSRELSASKDCRTPHKSRGDLHGVSLFIGFPPGSLPGIARNPEPHRCPRTRFGRISVLQSAGWPRDGRPDSVARSSPRYFAVSRPIPAPVRRMRG
jgi:uncharacterized membrane protein